MRQLRLLVCLAFLVLSGIPERATAQDPGQHSIYVELLGNGLIYSLNYDRMFTSHLGGRAGFMAFGGESEEPTDDRVRLAIFPVMANYLVGSGNHRLELGAGLQFAVAGGELEDYGSFAGGGVGGVTTTIGYRYQPVEGGFLFRIGLTPFYSAGEPQLWGGLSLGYAF